MNNWFKPSKNQMIFIIGLLAFSSIMYIPSVYKLVNAGTSFQFIWATIVLIVAPILGFVDIFISTPVKKGEK